MGNELANDIHAKESGGGIEVRAAQKNEAASIANILAEAFSKYRSHYTTEAFTMMTPDKEGIEKRFGDSGEIWVAALNGAIVGTISAVHRGDVLYVRSLAIRPAVQGLKIGSALLWELENYSGERGFKLLELVTGEFLPRALKLYERFGFTRRRGVDFYGTRLILMEKHLPNSWCSDSNP